EDDRRDRPAVLALPFCRPLRRVAARAPLPAAGRRLIATQDQRATPVFGSVLDPAKAKGFWVNPFDGGPAPPLRQMEARFREIHQSNLGSRSGSRKARQQEGSMNSVCARVLARAGVAVGAILAAGSALAQSGDVNVYTYRESKLIQPLFDAFTKDTGIKVNVISASSGLEQRIKTEGANSPADVLLTVDIGRLEDAVRSGITQPIKSDVLDKVVAPQYRDPEGHWYGISMRARVAYASKDRVPQNALTYEELADPKWKGKICIRSGQHIYNNALFAAFIGHHGEAKTEEWLKGVKANLAQKPSGGDRETARDIAAGKCDIGIGNTYYWALMNNNEPDKKAWADATKVI